MNEIGYVTSKCFSPRLKKNIAFAFVPIEHTNQGSKFYIDSPYGKLESVVVELPFWDPKKQIPIGKVLIFYYGATLVAPCGAFK